MKTDLREIIKHENENWTRIFQAELRKNTNKKFSSFWWQDYYEQLSNYFNKLLIDNNLNTVLEPGSGSGKATILLDERFKKTLFDISSAALKYAKYLADFFGTQPLTLVEGDIFSMPFRDESFDFVWNIGVIEHYELEDISLILREMIRVCRRGGIVAVGMPNEYSGPILKAKILKFIKFIPGYKLDTEHFYKHEAIEDLFRESVKELGRTISYVNVKYFGNPLIMETPRYILKTLGRVTSSFFVENRFLIVVICKFE